MGFVSNGLGMMNLAEALRLAERGAIKSKEAPNLDNVLTIALVDAQAIHVKEAWRRVLDGDFLDPSRKLAKLVSTDSDIQPQAVGHALVLACREGYLICVRALRELQNQHCSGSLLVALFNAFGIVKAAEAGNVEVVQELLRPMVSASTAMMGYMLATNWKDKEGSEYYPFVENPENPPDSYWIQKLWSMKMMLPTAMPCFKVGWDLRSLSGSGEHHNEVIRSCYRTYLLWRLSVIAASQCHADVFRILLKRRWLDNLFLKETLSFFIDCPESSDNPALDQELKMIIANRAKMDMLAYQLVEEYSTKNYHDAMLYTLWKCCVSKQTGKDVGKPKCKYEGANGFWEIKLEVPVLMMPVESAATDEEPRDRYKHLTILYGQTAELSIQLLATVVSHTDFLQVSVAVKQVRFKADNSRWDEEAMGHFPTRVRVSVLPLTNEGSSVTLTNSSSNNEYTVGKGESLTLGSSATNAGKAGLGAGFSVGAGQVSSILMKSKPWRFEQVPLPDDDRGGSFQWTLQALKGVPFDRFNPIRMADSNSMWRWGRRVTSNPLDGLPFTSEGGVQFTSGEFSDTMMWRFPKKREGRKLRWRIEGEVCMTYTTSRYFETRKAQFCGEIEEPLVAAKPNFETKMNDFKEEVEELLGLAEPGTKIKPQNEPSLTKFNTTVKKQFLEWLEFRKELEEMQGGLSLMKGTKESPLKTEDKIEEGTEKETEKVTKPEEVVKAELKEEAISLSSVENHRPSSKPSLVRLKASKGAGDFDTAEETEKPGTERVEETVSEIKTKVSLHHRRGLSYIPPEETVAAPSVVSHRRRSSYSESPLEEAPQASVARSSRRGRNYDYTPPQEAPRESSATTAVAQVSSSLVRRQLSVVKPRTRKQFMDTSEDAPIVYLSPSSWSTNKSLEDENISDTPLSPSRSLSPPAPDTLSSITEAHQVISAPSLIRLKASKGKLRH
ncbi:uncharacterized protein [Physcomitrium patens]|uniref:Uncharacterized protein n=1 Tax=Physcomitrium patens TaxID=3218 RepID=A0A2K1JCT9_PHYPA|nr:uncharacterized protein LOC112292586 [Physcomitrium patens]XP_024396992.1 uncharacterized protein LOC112292586 [Physcomitrium patens]XP_024396993.1 uncharacterized protein LOC112292586 [Physcomitrium patens]XP_024396994.1 uncharacterized protein LOC112292586 [Physcomitrium patens]PNR39350.1 hypothetical protein PHYPA_019628 [Physcomitrium patens]|eukprot:XP_024396990.1 uncharacterized protein LOC112292586 [Physcomitrella patens]